MKPWVVWLLMGSAMTLMAIIQFIPSADDATTVPADDTPATRKETPAAIGRVFSNTSVDVDTVASNRHDASRASADRR